MDKPAKKVNTQKWNAMKTAFTNLTYPERIQWWERNVPLPDSIKPVLPVKFEYSPDFAPIVKSIFVQLIAGSKSDVRTMGAFQDTNDFISIIPRTDDNGEKRIFWEWIITKINLRTLEQWESYYQGLLDVADKANWPEMIQKENEIIEEEQKDNEGNQYFEAGRNLQIYKDFNSVNFGEPTSKSGQWSGAERLVNMVLLGFQNNLKQVALKNIETRDKKPTLEAEKTTKAITEPQKALILYYLLTQIKSDLEAVKQYTLMADLTDNLPKNTKQYFDSGFKNLFQTKSGNHRIEDLQFVRDYFLGMGLFILSERVQNQLNEIKGPKK